MVRRRTEQTLKTISASPAAEDAACVCQDRKKISADVKQRSGLASDGSVRQSVAVCFFFLRKQNFKGLSEKQTPDNWTPVGASLRVGQELKREEQRKDEVKGTKEKKIKIKN